MGKDTVTITEPDDLIEWLGVHDILMDLTEDDVKLLLGYMEGHGYMLGVNHGELVRIDMADDNQEEQSYPIDDVIDIVCEWNYELIQDANNRRENPENFIDYIRQQGRYDSYRKDEIALDRMFDMTHYGRDARRLAEQLAESVIEKYGQKQPVESIARDVAEEIGRAR